jgi:hypothetical protein
MKWLTTWVFMITLTGCTALRPIDGSPKELQELINAGELLKPGDRVRIVTADEKTHRLAITKIEAGLIVGPNESVPIDQIMFLEMENSKTPASLPFDPKVATVWLIMLGAFALKPITVDSTPSP